MAARDVLETVGRRAASFARTRRVTSPPPTLAEPRSQGCTFAQTQEPAFHEWLARMQHPWQANRKLWEWVYILRCLERSGMLAPGKRGLGFAVGTEPIAAVLASAGCTILATDLPGGEQTHWAITDEHAASLEQVNARGLCPRDVFADAVSFRPVDMRHVPDDLRGFDFLWSSCALEHLGTLDAGIEFVHRAGQCIAPGGVAVHTTEFNLSSDSRTIDAGDTVLYRRRDLEALGRALREHGYTIEFTFRFGDAPQDLHVDVPPFTDTHIRTSVGGYQVTSFGLFIRSPGLGGRN